MKVSRPGRWAIAVYLVGLLLLAAAAAAAEPLTLHVSPNPAAVYQKVTLSAIVPAGSPEVVSASFTASNEGIHIVSGPYIQPYVSESAPSSSLVRISYVIEANEPGRKVLPPVTIDTASGRRTTRPVVVSFGYQRGGHIVVPLEAAWRLPGREKREALYAGEAIAVVLELVNELQPQKADKVALTGGSSSLRPAKEFVRTRSRMVGQTRLYQVPVASYILTPTKAGTISLPTAHVSTGTRSGMSAPRRLRVVAPPAAISSSDAIGSLAFRSWTTHRPVKGGEEVSLHLRVEGRGNLPEIALPQPTARGLLELGRNETHSTSPGASGFRGFREEVYRYLLSSSSGPGAAAGSITVPSFSWLDPHSGKVSSVAAKSYSFAPPAGRAAAARSGGASARAASGTGAHAKQASRSGIPFAPQSAAAIQGSEYRAFYSRGKTYLWLLPGPVVFALFLLIRPRRKGRGIGLGASALFLLLFSCRLAPVQDQAASGVAAYRAGKLTVAARDLAAATASYPRNAPLSYDLALVEYRLGRYGEAVHYLRTAIYFAPLSRTYRSALDWMVKQIGVPEQASSAYPVPPDLFLIILIVAINAASLLGIFLVFKARGGLAIGLILCLVVALISGGGLVYSITKRSVETAVVKSSGTEMTKIPMAVAGRWLELPAGMAVRVVDSTKGYYLVKTAYGNTGWVRKDHMLLGEGRERVTPSGS